MKFPLPLILLTAWICMSSGFPQGNAIQEHYFRYFEISSPELDPNKLESFEQQLERNEHFQLHAFCAQQKRLLIAVNAMYPKRIEDIKSELDGHIRKSFRINKPLTISTISASEKDQVCQ